MSFVSTQDCFKASWSSHKSVHLKAKLSSPGTVTPTEQNSSSPVEEWLYCMKKGQARTPKIPYFDWTGYSPLTFIYLTVSLVLNLMIMLLNQFLEVEMFCVVFLFEKI